MSEQSIEELVAKIGSLKGALLMTVDDCLLYRSWQRGGEKWSVELGAARFGDVLRSTLGLSQVANRAHTLAQMTIESNESLTVIEPLGDAIAAVLLFDPGTPLGLVRYHLASVRDGLHDLASGVGAVGPPASRRASSLPASATGVGSVPPPPAPSSGPSSSSPITAASGPPPPPLPVPEPARAGARKISNTLVTAGLPPEPPPVPAAVMASLEPVPEPAGPTEVDTAPPYEEPEPSTVSPQTRPRKPHRRTSPLPGPIGLTREDIETAMNAPATRDEQPELPTGVALLAHLKEHAPDAHVALRRVALQTGIPLSALRDADALSKEQITKLESAAYSILGLVLPPR